MTFKDSAFDFQLLDPATLDPDPAHIRGQVPEEALKGLTNAIRRLGLIHPILVRPGTNGRYRVLVGERRRQAALAAGETKVPVLVRQCTEEEALDVQVFENLGIGVRAALEARDMATALHTIAARFPNTEEAAQYFGRTGTWLAQATAAANLSEKVTALLDAGKISSTGAAVKLEKLARKNEAKAESLIEHLSDGEKLSKKVVEEELSAASGRSRKAEAPAPEAAPVPTQETAPTAPQPNSVPADVAPWEDLPGESPAAPAPAAAPHARLNPGKIKLVAELLGLEEEDPETVLARLVDEFLATKQS